MVLVFMTVTQNAVLLSLAPQYMTFGTETYETADGHGAPCTTQGAAASSCVMTRISFFLNALIFRVSFFGVAFYVANWVFVGAVIVWALYVLACKRRQRAVDDPDSSDDDDDEVYRALTREREQRRAARRQGAYST